MYLLKSFDGEMFSENTFHYSSRFSMKTALKKRIISEIEGIPDSKASSLLNYIQFLKYADEINIPNKITEQTFQDSDNGKNITDHASLDDFFSKIES